MTVGTDGQGNMVAPSTRGNRGGPSRGRGRGQGGVGRGGFVKPAAEHGPTAGATAAATTTTPSAGRGGRGRGRGDGRGVARGLNVAAVVARPAREKKNYNPAQVVLDNTIKKRTSEQVKSDQERALAAAQAAEAAAAATKILQRQQVAALEDDMQAEQDSLAEHTIRPDLQQQNIMEVDPEELTGTDADAAEGTHHEAAEENELMEEDDNNFPPESTMDSESCPSEGISCRWDEGDDEGDGDLEDDRADQSCSEKSDDETSHAEVRQKGKSAKPQRGEFRAGVRIFRQKPPAPSGPQLATKRKPDNDLSNDHGTGSTAPSAKRTKSEPGGLVANWKVKVGLKSGTARKAVEDVNSESVPVVEGEFDKDEAADALNAARAAKSNVRVQPGSKSAGIKITEAKFTGNGRVKREKYTSADLPFPLRHRQKFHARWQRTFRPTLIAWASAFDNPYATNTELKESTLVQMWNQIFHDVKLEEAQRESLGAKLIYLAGPILNDWRTTIGSGALTVVKNFFGDPENQFDSEGIIEYVEWALNKETYNFIYASPEGPQKGGFQSSLILETFALHIKKSASAAGYYGHPVGGMGICTAAVERALSFWRTGEDASIKTADNGKKKSASAFGEAEWGSSARAWAQSAGRLSDEQWDTIYEEGIARGGITLQDGEGEGEDSSEADPRTLIELWWVYPLIFTSLYAS